MMHRRRTLAFLSTASALLAVLVPAVIAQAPRGSMEILATVISVNADDSRIDVRALGQPRSVPVAADAPIRSADGQPLPGGLRSPALAEGAEETLTLGQIDGALTVIGLRLGRHVPEQRMLRGSAVGLTPLTELSGDDRYGDEDGGLYGGGRNTPPPAHLAAAEAATGAITPRDASGAPAPDGTIGFVSISMSNATMEFSTFKQIADGDRRKSARVAIVDCAQSGQAMAQWVDPDGAAWREADRRLLEAGVSSNQVQVAWIKLANIAPAGALADHGRTLSADTLVVLQNAKRRYPNLKIVYLGSRIFAGYATGGLNPEPYAYESAFIVRWLIRDQMAGEDALRHTGDASPVPLLLWGPYLWADGMTPRRADGLVWERSDLAGDGTHPSDSGRRKVANLLLEFFTSDELARRWFAVTR